MSEKQYLLEFLGIGEEVVYMIATMAIFLILAAGIAAWGYYAGKKRSSKRDV